MLLKVLAVLFLFVVAGCAGAPVNESLDKVETGMDKGTVLGLAGNPRRTFHTSGQDHWLYTFYKDDREFMRQIVFQSGKVVSIGTPHMRRPATDDKEAESLEDVEKELRQEQAEKPKGEFKDVESPN